MTVRESLNHALDEELANDENVFLIGIFIIFTFNRRRSRIISGSI